MSTSSQTERSALSRRTFPLRGSFVPAKFHWRRSQRIHDTTIRSNMKRDVYIRKELYDVVLSSGTTIVQKCCVYTREELCAMSCCQVARPRSKCLLCARRRNRRRCFIHCVNQGSVTREGHGRERLVSRKMALCPATWC